MVINLLSSPRNVSTALMYSFAQRSDTKVVDEPFYGNYLARVTIDHPGKDEIIASMPSDAQKIIEDIEEQSKGNRIVFLKNMAHHMIDLKIDFMNTFRNVLFIRNPAQIISSFSKVIPNPTIRDIGVRIQLELFDRLTESASEKPIVVDSAELIQNPQKLLAALCDSLNIPFEVNMLSWTKGGISEDGIWAKYWYSNVHNSTGFQPPNQVAVGVPEHLSGLLKEALPYYNELRKHKIKI